MDDATGDSPTLDPAVSPGGGTIAARYRLRGTLGRGATKVVYLAHDERLDRDVALAVIAGAAEGSVARARVARDARRIAGGAPRGRPAAARRCHRDRA